MSNMTPENKRCTILNETYYKREIKYNSLSAYISKAISNIVLSKYVFIIISFVIMAMFYNLKQSMMVIAVLSVLIIGYVLLDKKHVFLTKRKVLSDILADINFQGAKRLNGQWRGFKDDGSDLIVPGHPYASDLDIIGRDSLFQWISMCATPWGRRALSKALLYPDEDTSITILKQKSIGELSKKINFRHRLRAEGIKLNASDKEYNELVEWAQTKEAFYQKPWASIVVRGLPFITILLLFSGLVLKLVPSFIPLAMFVFQSLLIFSNWKKATIKFEALDKCSKSLKKLEDILVLLEKHKFREVVLKNLKARMLNDQKGLPSRQIRDLAALASGISNRNNMLHILLNILLLWDYQYFLYLEKWKAQSGKHLGSWLEIIGEFEALSSIALINYNHPQWVMPAFEEDSSYRTINAAGVGHPLLGSRCVVNDIQFSCDQPIALITGSNMSGKSTFLRTIGVNLVLASIGSVVYAAEFTCKPMRLYTCMRVADDLQNNISSFYGEIIRIKMIIDQAKTNGRVFFYWMKSSRVQTP